MKQKKTSYMVIAKSKVEFLVKNNAIHIPLSSQKSIVIHAHPDYPCPTSSPCLAFHFIFSMHFLSAFSTSSSSYSLTLALPLKLGFVTPYLPSFLPGFNESQCPTPTPKS